MVKGYSKKGVEYIFNMFVEVSKNYSKVTLVGFYDDLYKKSILVKFSSTFIDLTNGNIIDKFNNTPLLLVGSNSLVSISQDREFGVSAHNVAKHYGVKQYIHSRDRFSPMKFDKALNYVPNQEPTQWDTYNLDFVILTSFHP